MKKKDYTYLDSEDFYEIAYQWIELKDYEKAELYLKESLACNDLFIYAYVTLSEVYEKQERNYDAIQILKRALKKDPTFDKLPYLIAKNYLTVGDIKRSYKYIERALEIQFDPEYILFKEQLETIHLKRQ